MFIIIKKLPKLATVDLIEYLISPALQKTLFSKQRHIKAIKIIGLMSKEHKVIEYFALVRLCSENAETRVVKYLNSDKFSPLLLNLLDGFQSLEASRFQIRSYSKDRRSARRTQLEDRRKFCRLIPLEEKVFGVPGSKTWFENKKLWESEMHFILSNLTQGHYMGADSETLPTDYVEEEAA